MTISQKFLSILRCPTSGSPLVIADEPLLAQINARIREGQLKNRIGETIDDEIDEGLVNEKGDTFYYLRNNIPTLIDDNSIPLNQL